MTSLRLILPLALVSACTADSLLGPLPGPEPHFTAMVDNASFVGQVFSDGCIGTQITPTMFFVNARLPGTWPTPEISIELGGITGPGRVSMRPNEIQGEHRSALYIPDDPGRLQYSAPTGSGNVLIDEYDADRRTIAGRFYFNAHRAVGTAGAEWVEVRQGSFRGKLRAWGSQMCT